MRGLHNRWNQAPLPPVSTTSRPTAWRSDENLTRKRTDPPGYCQAIGGQSAIRMLHSARRCRPRDGIVRTLAHRDAPRSGCKVRATSTFRPVKPFEDRGRACHDRSCSRRSSRADLESAAVGRCWRRCGLMPGRTIRSSAMGGNDA
jgi:hypothetical protein